MLSMWVFEIYVCIYRDILTYSCNSINYPSSARLRYYYLVTEPKTWVQAQSYCRQKYTDLATVDSMAEMEELKGFIPPGNRNVWGIFSDSDDSVDCGLGFDNWLWSDGSKTTFRYWHPGQPYSATDDGNCAMVSTSWGGDWDDTACNGVMSFMCYKGHQENLE
uniref:C-type lectin domain-containing protein n=1 Tax=Astyanax mexicanus TaxID=7994 RepID=A0A3B1JWF9_ASTMX